MVITIYAPGLFDSLGLAFMASYLVFRLIRAAWRLATDNKK